MSNQKKTKIIPNMTFGELISQNQKAATILAERGLFCGGCPMAQFETIEQGATVHGLSKKEIKELIEELNNANN